MLATGFLSKLQVKLPKREIVELNIGHFLIGEAMFTGLKDAIVRMRQVITEAGQFYDHRCWT